MSVSAKRITKSFGSQVAVNELSFEVKAGEILGFLGPNGAGKSTTMKILTGFLDADSGEVNVGGFNPATDPEKAKQVIGYLPESNPLYTDLYVREYLSIIGQAHGISNLRNRVQEVIDLTGLNREAHKRIHQLSKGYKQRVGLAQSLIHDPEVLILDEPTSGLDPNQLKDIRSLIKSLGKSKAIILSTHIMQEVQAVCDRVVIIDQGKMVFDQPIEYLSETGSGGQVVEVEFERRILTNSLEKLKAVKKVEEIRERVYKVSGPKGEDLRKAIFKYAVDHSAVILEMRRVSESVEDIFQIKTRGAS